MAREGRRDRWTNAWAIERVDQLIYDLSQVSGRYVTECLRAAEQGPPEERAEWQEAATRGEAALREMKMRCAALFERYARAHKEIE